VHLVLAEQREGNDRDFAAELREAEVGRADDRRGDGSCVVRGKTGLERAVRRQCELELPQDVVRHTIEIHAREWHWCLTVHVPRVVAARNRGDMLLGYRHPSKRRTTSLSAS